MGTEDAALPERLRQKREWLSADRARAAAAWRASRKEEDALALARAYFPELSNRTEKSTREAPNNPSAALRVKLPEAEGAPMELATRGYVFRVREIRAREGLARETKEPAGAAFYGSRHFWTRVGGVGMERGGAWRTQRVEEYVVLDEGGQPYRSHYEVEVPRGVIAVKDAGEYLEFVDRENISVLRLHHPVARDDAGRSRQGVLRLWGVTPERERYALRSQLLRVEATVQTEAMTGPVLIDPGWSSTGTMAAARQKHTATLLPSGKVLVAGGVGSTVLASAEVYDPETRSWASAGSMASARRDHTATLLPSGKVLIAGGIGSSVLATAEVYDPTRNSWEPTASMASARFEHTATLLPSGKVLVAGGAGSSSLATAEVYDPNPMMGSWAPTGSMASARHDHTATLLPSLGTVLVVGGFGSAVLASAEIYDPGTGNWRSTDSMDSPRYRHAMTVLPSGKVLVTGGASGGSYFATAEVYDPTAALWAPAPSMSGARAFHTATLLPSGHVLVAGGANAGAEIASAELYNPIGGWAPAAPMAAARASHAAVMLPSGHVLVAGGTDESALASAEEYEPAMESWASTGSMATARHRHTATLLPSGKLLVAGGSGAGGAVATGEVYDPMTGSWMAAASLMTSARERHTATLLPTGKVLVAGGDNASTSLATAELYDAVEGAWTSTGSMGSARASHTATLLPSGKVLVAGGRDENTPLGSAEVYDPALATGSWAPASSMTSPRASHTATLLSSGKVLVVGGENGSDSLVTAEIYDPEAGSWTLTGPMTQARAGHTATVLPSGKVLVTGGASTAGTFLATAEVYDPATGSWSSAGSMAAARASHTATLLPSGRVLVAGGTGPSALGTAELYDPVTQAWSSTLPMASTRHGHTATLLPLGKILVAGGLSGSSATSTSELYEDTGASDAWRPVINPIVRVEQGANLTAAGAQLTGFSEGSFPLLRFSAIEGGSSTLVLGSSFSNMEVTLTVPDLPNGYYVLFAVTNAIPGGVVVKILDTTPPPKPVIATPRNCEFIASQVFRISGTATGGRTVQISFDGTSSTTRVENDEWNHTVTAHEDDAYTITAHAIDSAGAGDKASVNVTVDTKRPLTTVTAPTGGTSVKTGQPTISGKTEPYSTVTVFIDDVALGTATADSDGNWSYMPESPLIHGVHSVNANAVDRAGNIGDPSDSVRFTVRRSHYTSGCSASLDPLMPWGWQLLGLGLWSLCRKRRSTMRTKRLHG